MEQLWMRELCRYLDARFEHLDGRLDDLRQRVETLQASTGARLDAHETYHRTHEHRWGLIKLAGRHPFRLAAVAMTGAAALQGLAPGSLRGLGRLARAVMAWLGG